MKKTLQKLGVFMLALSVFIPLSLPASTSAEVTKNMCSSLVRNLTIGSTGSDVVILQTYLEEKGFLTIPAGVPKGYFGPLTRASVARFQVANQITPAVGYFGPITQGKLIANCALNSDSADNEESNTGNLSGGEASLEKFSMDSEDDAEEGKMMHIATIEFDVEDADAEINRMDISFEFAGSGSADDEPWDAFETITLMVDGDEIAEEDIDDEDDWLRDNSPFVFRLSGLDYVVEEGDTAEIEVYLTSNKHVDGANDGDATWTIYVDDEGIRAIDGEGIQQYIGDDNETVTFDVEVLGEGEEIQIKSSSSDPDATTLLVDTNDESDWHEVFVFELEAEENDIDLDELVLKAMVSGTTTFDEVVDDMYIEIDGDEFDDYDVTGGNTATATLTFDLDKDATVDGDDSVDVAVFVKFNKQNPNYNIGTTFTVETVSVEGEGLDDVSDNGVVSSETHTLSTSVAEVTNLSWVVAESANGATGIIDLFFTITAEEDDFEVLGADILDSANGTFATPTGVIATSGFGKLTRVSGDSVTTLAGDAGFRVNEGDRVRFRVRYETTTAGSHEVTVTSVAGQELADDDQLSPTIVLE